MKNFVIYDLDEIRRSGIPGPDYPGQFMNRWTQAKADLYFADKAYHKIPLKARRDEYGHIWVCGLKKAEVVSNVSSDWEHDNKNMIDFHKHLCAAFDRDSLDEWAVYASFEDAILRYQYKNLHEISEMIDSENFNFDP